MYVKTYFKCILCLLMSLGSLVAVAQPADAQQSNYPQTINVGPFKAGHVQGIAVDRAKGYVYYSFTTLFVKTDLQGKVIGFVKGLLGHLGCLDFNPEDGRVYGSLEYKNDAIGKGILSSNNKSDLQLDNAFYIAIFDVDKITRENMDAEKDGVMTSVFLPEVLNDYLAKVNVDGKTVDHRFCCSGIDGVSFGPKFGKTGGRRLLTVAYGVYGDNDRPDNDYQVLLQYDTHGWNKYESTLLQNKMHKNGPQKPNGKYFAFTGNTSYGVQNLEYDEDNKIWLMAVYYGHKSFYPNYGVFAIDGTAKPEAYELLGVPYEKNGKIVKLAQLGKKHETSGIYGWKQSIGNTGMESLGNGLFYMAGDYSENNLQRAELKLYRFNPSKEEPFTLVE